MKNLISSIELSNDDIYRVTYAIAEGKYKDIENFMAECRNTFAKILGLVDPNVRWSSILLYVAKENRAVLTVSDEHPFGKLTYVGV